MIVVHCPACNAKLAAHRTKPDGTFDCPQCGQSMTLPTVAADADTIDSPPPDPNRTLTVGGGTIAEPGLGIIDIPGFEVIEEIGRGGMGVVYKARQLNPPRFVALKMILAGEHADTDQLIRFRTEAQATARLTHPAIVHIHHIGEWHPPSGGPPVPYLTLEYVEGHPLTERLKESRRIKPQQAANLIQRLARGVHYAHKQGIVHRDLKPSNVLVTGEETAEQLGEPKIVDFGLAKTLDGFGSIVSDGPHTQSGAVLGTPSYMAPEQAAGKKSIGPAADVYALGAILYELLTGRPPFLGESTVETLLAVVKEPPEPPRRLRSNVPRDLETICLKCLAKDPADRYSSAAALAKDLERFLDDEPIATRAAGRSRSLGQWLRSPVGITSVASAMLVLVVAGVVVMLANRPRPTDTTQTPVNPEPSPQPPAANPPSPPPQTSSIEDTRRKVTSSNNLKQLAIGLHNMHDSLGSLPPAVICDMTGKPLLSWRVAILPHIEHDYLYRQFRMDEPWDSEHNKQFITMMPPQFTADRSGRTSTGMTHYQAIVGRNTPWELRPFQQFIAPFGRRGSRLTEFTDGTSNTILLAEVAEPVIWTKPEDATYDGQTLPKFGGVVPGGFTVAMADGSTIFIRDNVKPTDLRHAITMNDGMVLSSDWNIPPTAAAGTANLNGRVTYQGRPVPGGTVTFASDGALGSNRIGLFIQPDGSYSGSRLQPGTYRVAVVYAPAKDGSDKDFVLPQQYADVNTSELRIDLRPGQNTYDIELK